MSTPPQLGEGPVSTDPLIGKTIDMDINEYRLARQVAESEILTRFIESVHKADGPLPIDEWRRKFVSSEEIDAILSREANCLALQWLIAFKAYFPTKKIEAWAPADWWEAFKERWFPSWLLRKTGGIRYKHISISAILEAQSLHRYMGGKIRYFVSED